MYVRKRPAISIHSVLHGQLEINWDTEYNNEFNCIHCNSGQYTGFNLAKNNTCKLSLICNTCRKGTALTCRVKTYTYRYYSDIECPNPLCTQRGCDGQKGWIYATNSGRVNCKCRFCNITFKSNATAPCSWVGSQIQNKLLAFSFDEDIWNLKHFYDKPFSETINFKKFRVQWYKLEVKKYLHQILKSHHFSSDSSIKEYMNALRQFDLILCRQQIEQPTDICRKTILDLLDTCRNNRNSTINQKLCKDSGAGSYIQRDFHFIKLV